MEKELQVPLRNHLFLSARQAVQMSVFASDTLLGFKSIYVAIYFTPYAHKRKQDEVLCSRYSFHLCSELSAAPFSSSCCCWQMATSGSTMPRHSCMVFTLAVPNISKALGEIRNTDITPTYLVCSPELQLFKTSDLCLCKNDTLRVLE